MEIAKAVFNDLAIQDVKVFNPTDDNITMIKLNDDIDSHDSWQIQMRNNHDAWSGNQLPHILTFLYLSSFIPQLFASSLLPHITQKFSVDQLIQIGLPLV